jgi:hypothetical protein
LGDRPTTGEHVEYTFNCTYEELQELAKARCDEYPNDPLTERLLEVFYMEYARRHHTGVTVVS